MLFPRTFSISLTSSSLSTVQKMASKFEIVRFEIANFLDLLQCMIGGWRGTIGHTGRGWENTQLFLNILHVDVVSAPIVQSEQNFVF